MECMQCGATLRPGARFCNVCGTRQSTGDGSAETAVRAGAPETIAAEPVDDPGASGGRMKRPPRVPRADADDAPRTRETAAPVTTDMLDLPEEHATIVEGDSSGEASMPPELAESDGEAVQAEAEEAGKATSEASAEGTPVTDAEAPMAAEASTAATDEVEEVPAEGSPAGGEAEVDAHVAAAAPEETNEEQAQEPDLADAETAEYSTILAAGRKLHVGDAGMAGQGNNMPPLESLARAQAEHGANEAPRDGMPWPLPTSIIMGGRYRVEAVLSTAPEAPGGENVYRVHDLQGYERCWSCGAEHGASAATDVFCQQCGADMLGRDYIMSERLLVEGESLGEERDAASASGDGSADDSGDSEAQTERDMRIFIQGTRAYRVAPFIAETPLFPYGPRVTAAAATDTGATRAGEVNEDSHGLVVLNMARESRTVPFALAVVADGLGGHANGQEASQLVVRKLTERVLRSAALPYAEDPRAAGHELFENVGLDALRAGIEDANVALCTANGESGADMGSTLVALLLFGTTSYLANVGDSRAYVLDDGGLRRVTTDHSLVEQLVAAGQITPEERYTHPQRNQIMRSIGDELNVPVDLFQQQLRPGMRFLLCSDGLWEMVRDDECERILRDAVGPQQACDALVRAANANGGEDNITAIVVEVSA